MKVAVLGCGNMASAIVKSTYAQDSNLYFYTFTPSITRAKDLADKVNGECFKSLANLPSVDLLMIACKPQQFNDLCKQLSPYLKPDQLVVSVLAATDLESLQKGLKIKNISRIMPNTPCEVSEGISLVLHAKELSEKHREMVNSFFGKCSKVFEVSSDEELDLLTVVAGSGPAYIFEFASGLEKFLMSKGIARGLSKNLVDQLFLGSSKLMQKSDISYDKLVDAVTSKAGVTIEAINTYRKFNLSDISFHSLDNALKRSKQITQEIKGK